MGSFPGASVPQELDALTVQSGINEANASLTNTRQQSQPGPEAVSPAVPNKARTASVVGLVTVGVAVAGYLREAILAAHFGVTATMDAYFASIFIPNILYLVLIAGTLSPVFIPILLQEDPEKNPEKASATFSIIANFALLTLVSIVACGVLGARLWLPALFPGFNPATADLAVRLVYIIFPALPFLAAAGILTALLNGFHRFWLAAFAPALSSISVIAATLLFRGDRAIYAVGIATALGFLLQCLVLLPASLSLGIRYRPILAFRHPAIRKLLKLGVPLFLYLVVANVSAVLERSLASRISAGAVSTLTYAFRLFTVPANFLAAPLAIVAYPGFAREAARDQRGELAGQTSRLFQLVIFLFLPVTVWTILNANIVTRFLYEHGKFSEASSTITANLLAIYCFGIVPNAIAIVLLRCFYAIEDTVTPLLTELAALAYFVIAAPYFTHRFGIGGLVAARTVSFFLVTIALLLVLRRRYALLRLDFETLRFFFRVATATCVMALLCWAALHLLYPVFNAGHMTLRLAIVVCMMLVGGGSFLAAAHILGLSEAKQIMNAGRGWFARQQA